MGVYAQEKDNIVKWHDGLSPFYEVYYLKMNFAKLHKALWLRYTLLSPEKKIGSPSASVWFMLFDQENPHKNLALKETVKINQATLDTDIFYFQILENAIYNTGARGGLASAGHQVSWDIEYPHNEDSFRLYPRSFYHLSFPKTKLLSPNWSVFASGVVRIDGERLEFKDAPTCQAHLWGTQHAEKWAWAHCNTFDEDKGAVFEALSGQVRVVGRLVPPMTVFSLRLGDGRKFKFNALAGLLFNKGHYDLHGWELEGQRGHYKLKVSIVNEPREMIGVTYTDPNGSKLYCYHNEFALFRLDLLEHRKGKYHLYQTLSSAKQGAFEVVERSPFPDMPLSL